MRQYLRRTKKLVI